MKTVLRIYHWQREEPPAHVPAPLAWVRTAESQRWKAPLESIYTPSLGAGSARAGCSGPCPAGFEYLQRGDTQWRLHNLSGQPVPAVKHPLSKKVFSYVQTEPPVFPFMPIVPSLSFTQSSLGLSSLHPVRYVYTLIISTWAFSSPGCVVSSRSLLMQQQLLSLNHVLVFLALWWTLSSRSMFLLSRGTQNWLQHSRCVALCLSRAGRPPPSTCCQCSA